jgi:hypothetical protein
MLRGEGTNGGGGVRSGSITTRRVKGPGLGDSGRREAVTGPQAVACHGQGSSRQGIGGADMWGRGYSALV